MEIPAKDSNEVAVEDKGLWGHAGVDPALEDAAIRGFWNGNDDEEGSNGRGGGCSHSTGTPLHSTSTSTRRRSLCQHQSRCPPGLHRRVPARWPLAQIPRQLRGQPPLRT